MSKTWKEVLTGKMPEDLAREVEIFETQIELRKQGKLDEKIFAETRLRRGTYGQRYDNGQRHDGEKTQKIGFPELTKGPETYFDAPGMQRIKIPYGGVTPEQLEEHANLAEEYSVNVVHITTRQDFQMHYIHLDNTPDLMYRLAGVGITTREACGNSVRNVTGCPYAGICQSEAFDVTPYAKITAQFLMGHEDTKEFGRKFKIAFSGCEENPCALVALHDLGAIARVRDGQRGFGLYVGGGLGAVPHQAKLIYDFVPENEFLKVILAVCRIFARLGEKKNRARARIKFLVAKLGVDEFRKLIEEELPIIPHDDRWTGLLDVVEQYSESPLKKPMSLNGADRPEGFDHWYKTNVYRQKQDGYVGVTVRLTLGDISAWQLRRFADVCRKYCGDNVRTTVEQNFFMRWVSEADLVDLYKDLKAIGLDNADAHSIVDVVACPGTDSCKLGISSSRGLAAELTRRLESAGDIDPAIKDLSIKISGCFNSCGQHHIADIGFYGVNRNVGGYAVPHFQLILGGTRKNNAGSYGLAIGAIPSKNAPEVVDRISKRYRDERQDGESFQEFIERIGKRELKEMFSDLTNVPSYDEDRNYYSDWGDPREYTHGDRGTGECAGEVVNLLQFSMADAEREVFEAQILLDEKKFDEADAMAFQAMLSAARGLVKTQFKDVPTDPDVVVDEFRKRFYDTEIFFDKYMKGKFAEYLLDRHARGEQTIDRDTAHRSVEEAQLFIEAAFACQSRLPQQETTAGAPA